MSKFNEYKGLNLPNVAKQVLEQWEANKVFEQSVTSRDENKPFVFFEGPPSANGLPGIHHVMARAIKDIFCRYKTLKGYQVKRKAGWDTHGLPVELGVEKELGITKEDIGKKITIEEYNNACKEAVMRYTDVWNNLTRQMGYWVDMNDPYITYENKYIESVWWLLGQLHQKGLMYKGYTIQPYSPKAGTGLSSHELNQPGCYRDVKDTTCVAQFKLKGIEKEEVITIDELHDDENEPVPHLKPLNPIQEEIYRLQQNGEEVFFLAWTTTPWTLPSNTALAVGSKISYFLVKTINQYSGKHINIILAKDLFSKYFEISDNIKSKDLIVGNHMLTLAGTPYENPENILNDDLLRDLPKELINKGRISHWDILAECIGNDLISLEYEQLLPYAQPYENADKAFRVIPGDFVTTEDGTGIVHIAPTFGADDAKVAKDAGVPPMLVLDENFNPVPLVDLQGKFRPEMGEFAGKYVKNEYYKDGEAPEKSVDVEISIKLKEENKAFKVEKYEHSYPHCWRTDKPILYYPLDSWFIKTTAVKERMIALNKTINWKPESTGTGRFGNWLENLNDWNLSRSRYWGIPIPIWRTETGDEEICISSVEQLKAEIEKSIAAGFMTNNPLADFEIGNMDKTNYDKFDLHKNYVDNIVLVSPSGKPMKRETDLIDVWFDSGSMPTAQLHYPFENKDLIEKQQLGVADFIAEGVDQTRGWFFTLHAIATMVFDHVAYKNVVSNGLVLDKNGQKMSKRLGNAVDPFETLDKYGPDATRWYMITNAQPWDNLKFDLEGITEVQRKFFGTLYNTYGFFALYANLDNFTYAEAEVPIANRPEIDRWIISKLNSLIKDVDAAYHTYEPTRAGRAIQEFVNDHLSNWYVRLCRRRFWKGDYSEDKIAAYQTLYTCLEVVAQLASPIAPFYSDKLYTDLASISGKGNTTSVHLSDFPTVNESVIDTDLEQRMDIAQQVSSMVLSLRKKEQIKVRQPLQKLMIPILNATFKRQLQEVADLILSEVNVKEIEYLEDTSGVLVKSIKPNFKTLGPKYGKIMKQIAAQVNQFTQNDIQEFERNQGATITVEGQQVELDSNDVEIITQDIPGWLVQTEGGLTVALDITISKELKEEGIAREFVNRIQNLRKDSGFEVTDKIALKILQHNEINEAINNNKNYICTETLTSRLDVVNELNEGVSVEIDQNLSTLIAIEKFN
ncbi:MAG: isoleucine--tRNA ligase [Flavobacteriales bacterium]|nr:isoleucine--tRNA ligase [Flavobacteriales bacterium]|tara:strand:- start:81371 stop:84946 length:3576 start_codon:yes stop_codon:yes gene_type:complete